MAWKITMGMDVQICMSNNNQVCIVSTMSQDQVNVFNIYLKQNSGKEVHRPNGRIGIPLGELPADNAVLSSCAQVDRIDLEFDFIK